MKKRLYVILALALFLLLPACEEKSVQVRGLVTEVQTGEDGALTAFVVRESGGRQTGVLLTQGTRTLPALSGSWTDAELRAEFQAALRPDVQISAWCAPKKEKLTTEDGQEVAAYLAGDVTITGRLNRGAVTLRDGTAIDVLTDDSPAGDRTYCLSDGAELLWARGPSGPEHHYVGGVESFDDLSEQAKGKVSAWYEAQGALFDEAAELEAAYAAWKAEGADFRCRMVEQNVSPSASSEKVMYFLTTVTLPYYGGEEATVYELRRCDAFDRETGERVDAQDLFTCPWEQVVRAVLDEDTTLDAALRAELEAALTPERLEIFPGNVSVSFEPDVLPSHTPGWGYSLSAQVTRLMQPWAVPKGRTQ